MTRVLLDSAGLPALYVVSWLLTYLLHSTLLLCGVWLLLRLRSVSPAWEEALWKMAVFGGVLTATAHVLVDVDPVESWELGPPRVGASSELARHWAVPLALGWITVALVLLLIWAWRQRSLLAALEGRSAVEGRPAAALRRLAGAADGPTGLRLSAARGLSTPIALGWREVVVPSRLLEELPPEELEAVIAHEVAHLRRRDPAWSLALGVLGTVLFFQPLGRLARRRLAEVAELRADEWAAGRTGSPLALARALAAVAAAASPHRLRFAGTAAMGEDDAGLIARVRRLLEPDGGRRAASRGARLVLVVAVLALVVLALPSFAPQEELDGQGEWPRLTARSRVTAASAAFPGTAGASPVFSAARPDARLR